ncbi:MAG: SPFH/Band 7/PHB domain protein [Actinobacteria bacterium]|nr:SPFH/Band 7/PHB domain protein [Actinomycetota bacterium]
MESIIVAAVVALIVIIVIARSVRIVPQAHAGLVERLGRYNRTLEPGLALIIPVVDRVKPLIDMREQVVSFPPQPVITEDNLVVNIDSVVYFQVTDAKAASYEIQDYLIGIEQITVTTLRNVIGGMDLETTLTSRDQINAQLRGVLDEATNRWGLRVTRVELKSIDPPDSVQQSMEKQMRAERDKRAAILTAEGNKQAAILTAEGERQAAILAAEGQAEAQRLRASGEAAAVKEVFGAVRDQDPDERVMAYEFMRHLPAMAQGESSKMWIVPTDLTKALGTMAGAFEQRAEQAGSEQG